MEQHGCSSSTGLGMDTKQPARVRQRVNRWGGSSKVYENQLVRQGEFMFLFLLYCDFMLLRNGSN